ncbi:MULTISPECIES: DUF2325 domain-containing protein [Paenibacillus]|jgi:hypothetical protein|uniref:DUF2325 domain-containing protein n=1 Tax=Paenibacillus baimaensis TaxID=2982185 RepID=A0ABT2UV85_9BACL|nr:MULTISPECIES: DUF2325 domain-containing protein [unclassified Paenibacillus]MCU6797727.1 DUF2325 domain-containing protein [Paenibacillus sp. WQ 127069]OMF20136.1 DUF2325 domain-containing protein [Paenibacillus sp. FSL H7-0331]
MKIVAIIGGSQTDTFKKMGEKRGVIVEHHNGKTGGGSVESYFLRIINKADVIIILKGAIKHTSMWAVRELAEKKGKKIDYHDGFGATGALEKALQIVG